MGLVEGRPLVEIGSEERVPSKRLVQVGVCLIEVVSQLVLQNWASVKKERVGISIIGTFFFAENTIND